MPFIKNIAFTRLIKINGRLREFNFRKRGDIFFDADTSDERGNRYLFKMEKDGNAWKLAGENLPGWLTSNEASISEALNSEEQRDGKKSISEK